MELQTKYWISKIGSRYVTEEMHDSKWKEYAIKKKKSLMVETLAQTGDSSYLFTSWPLAV